MGLLHEIRSKSDIQERVKIPGSSSVTHRNFLQTLNGKKVKFISLVSKYFFPCAAELYFLCILLPSSKGAEQIGQMPFDHILSCNVFTRNAAHAFGKWFCSNKKINIRQNILKLTGM